ncbi:uncharacterized protein BDCG_05856 [Blastomyces dermatitidis ER-3]|uniref:Uncharacterized protein n=2 Tax=Blastomyces TaxID=229219 RepID=A0A179UV28_BLAGS|nr:uncharacterized protein BDBG_06766 [Blastomyces gilchristii SLH14081]XP_045277414.1 uncharacterized protein BDCG_05856 [Blastomyces dermatitidis ER-3]EEQ90736.2 hypothetical protein BDCG_05856 [Blastomyces dermatitidis ER-3]EQL36669.1 hypothetical protein BDFG_02029 [Blastomyces dermatitidis ATCC 26199]OAT11008.1 hypothetical protein BDBG_06766 [Blastomyces gilchristii SLH14081]
MPASVLQVRHPGTRGGSIEASFVQGSKGRFSKPPSRISMDLAELPTASKCVAQPTLEVPNGLGTWM